MKNVALGYFLQHLESEGHGSLMKFWLDTSSFKSASIVKRSDIISPGCDSLDSGITSDLSSSTKPSNLSNLTEDAVQIYQRLVMHSVLRWVLTLKISNSKKEHVFGSRIYEQIMWYTPFLPP